MPQVLAIARLPAASGLPWWAVASAGLLSWVRTPDEVSVVCEERLVPHDVRAERGYRALRVAGTLPMQATGILAALAAPLAGAGIPVFAVSTFDTDYLLVPEGRVGDALVALRRAGHACDD